MIFVLGFTAYEWRHIQLYMEAVWQGLERPKLSLEATLDDISG